LARFTTELIFKVTSNFNVTSVQNPQFKNVVICESFQWFFL